MSGEPVVYHVYPLGDDRAHDTTTRGACWCRPVIEDGTFYALVLHHSADGREQYETGARRPH